jgi:hypothetical protein
LPSKFEADRQNLGLMIAGQAPFKSLYNIYSLHRTFPACKTLCGHNKEAVKVLNNEQIKIFSTLINERYQAEWIVDEMPVVLEVNLLVPLSLCFLMSLFSLGGSGKPGRQVVSYAVAVYSSGSSVGTV